MELNTLVILGAVFPALLVIVQRLISKLLERTNNLDVYTLSDKKGHKIKVVLKKRASAEERANIINRKVQELVQQEHQTA